MSIKFGEIDTSQILQNEFKIMVLEKIIEKLIIATPNAGQWINLLEIRKQVVEELQKKYPNSGIEMKG